MRHAFFGKVKLHASQGKYAIESPDLNPFQAPLLLADGGWIFFGSVKEVLGLIASVETFRSTHSGNVTALVTSHRLIDGPLTGATALMDFILPSEERLCEQLKVPVSLLEIGRSRFSEWCSVLVMGSHPMVTSGHNGIAIHWIQSRVKGPSAAGAIAQYFRQLSPLAANQDQDKRVYRAIGGHLLPNLS